MKQVKFGRIYILGVILSFACSFQALAATYTVTNTNPTGAGSLRDAINQANNNPGLDTIELPESLGEVFPDLSGQSVNDSAGFDNGSLFISDDLTIRGLGSKRKVINDHHTWITTSGGINTGYPCRSSSFITADSNVLFRSRASKTITLNLENITVTHTGGLIDANNVHLNLTNVALRNNTPHGRSRCNNGIIELDGDSKLTIKDSYFFRNFGPKIGSNFLIYGDVSIENTTFYSNPTNGLDSSYMLFVLGTSANKATVEIKDSLFYTLNNNPIYFIEANAHISNSLFDGTLSNFRSGFVGQETDLSLVNVTAAFGGQTRDPRKPYDIPATHVSMINGTLNLTNTALVRPLGVKGDLPIIHLDNSSITNNTNNYNADINPIHATRLIPTLICSESVIKCFIPPKASSLLDAGNTGNALYRDSSPILYDLLQTDRRVDNAIDIGALERPKTHANTDTYHTDQDTTLTISTPGVINNDTVEQGDLSRVSLKTGVQNGTLQLSSDGSFTYTPNTGFYGYDRFQYRLGVNPVNYTNVIIEVKKVSHTPIAQADHYNVRLGLVAKQPSPGVLGNDNDPDNVGHRALPYEGLLAVLSKDVSHGTLSLSGDGSFDYTADTTLPSSPTQSPITKTDSFEYYAIDLQGNRSNTATVTLQQVLPGKVPGFAANDDHYAMHQGETLNNTGLNLLDNDLTIPWWPIPMQTRLDQSPSNGSLTLNNDGSFVYTPNTGFVGTDTFSYFAVDGIYYYPPAATVTIDVAAVQTPGNNPPQGQPESYTVNLGSTLSLTAPGILTNDLDPDNQPPNLPNAGLTAVLVSDVSEGTLSLNTDGSFDYTSTGTTAGTDSFVYYAQDANNNTSSNITVTINLTQPPITNVVINSDHYNIHQGDQLITASSNSVISNDQFNGVTGLTAVVDKQPIHGTLAFNSDGTFTYTPDSTYTGDDRFSYYLTDGTTNYAPHGSVTISIVSTSNRIPAAGSTPIIDTHSDHYCTQKSSLITTAGYGVLNNDINNANSTGNLATGLSATLSTNVSNGTLSLNSDGSFTYIANSGFTGQDSFSYIATSTQGTTTTQGTTVSLVIDPNGCGKQIQLVANDDHFILNKNQRFNNTSFNMLDNDSLTSQTGMQAKLAKATTHGTVTVNTDGSVFYTPNQDFFGTDSFTYYFELNGQHSNTAHVFIDVLDANEPPLSELDHFTIYNDSANSFSAPGVLINDIDPETNDYTGLIAVIHTLPQHGTLSMNSDGSFTYTPQTNYVGDDSFTYYAIDKDNVAGNVVTVDLSVHTPIDSDGDGIPNHKEPGDYNGNGISDAQEPQGNIKTDTSAGSVSFLLLAALFVVAILRKRSVVYSLIFIPVLWVNCTDAMADTQANSGYHLEIGAGITHLKPKIENNDWLLGNQNGPNIGIGIGYHSDSFWSAAIRYDYLGSIKVHPQNPNLQTTKISYQSLSASLHLHWYNSIFGDFPPYAIIGVNRIYTNVSGEKDYVEQVNENQIIYGLGVDLLHSDNSKLAVEGRIFSGDVHTLGLRFQVNL